MSQDYILRPSTQFSLYSPSVGVPPSAGSPWSSRRGCGGRGRAGWATRPGPPSWRRGTRQLGRNSSVVSSPPAGERERPPHCNYERRQNMKQNIKSKINRFYFWQVAPMREEIEEPSSSKSKDLYFILFFRLIVQLNNFNAFPCFWRQLRQPSPAG